MCFLLGLALTLSGFYLYSRPNDRPAFRVLVTAVALLDTLHACFMVRFRLYCKLDKASELTIRQVVYLFSQYITKFGDFAALPRFDWRSATMQPIHSATAALVQGFFCFRLAIESQQRSVTDAQVSMFHLLHRTGHVHLKWIFSIAVAILDVGGIAVRFCCA